MKRCGGRSPARLSRKAATNSKAKDPAARTAISLFGVPEFLMYLKCVLRESFCQNSAGFFHQSEKIGAMTKPMASVLM